MENLSAISNNPSIIENSLNGIVFSYSFELKDFTYINEVGTAFFGVENNCDTKELRIFECFHKFDLLRIMTKIKESKDADGAYFSCSIRMKNCMGQWELMFSKFGIFFDGECGNVIRGVAYPLTDGIINSSLFMKSIKMKGISDEEMNRYNTLTKREKEILNYICDGFRNKAISELLFISKGTVDTHRKRILQKLEVRSSMELHKYKLPIS